MKRPRMKLKKHSVSKRQAQAIGNLPKDKQAFIKRRILMGDTLRQAKKRGQPINA